MTTTLFLGRAFDPAAARAGADVAFDAADLLTHGLIVGMTGSGKTGLAIALIEETLRKGIPVLAIDPKGDLGNLLLLFERYDAAAFAPWIDPEAARRSGQTIDAAAASAASAWNAGVAEWGLSAADAVALAASRDAVIYTPGSTAGVPLDVLQSLAAPSVPFESAEEDLRDEIAGIVAGLLGLLRTEADPLQSRESILLSTLIESAWRAGRSLSLESLLAGVADPPFEKLGALPLESVYPRRERQGLMLALNNLLAAPSFEAWREGEPLDVAALLRTPEGRPRLSVVSTAHLSEDERIFVTALLLDKVKTWMRRQGGTSELRALVYMDEVYGYFPPHPANPPTKRPLLTLLKQARAQGVGVVLATQNPVDLDYKALANMGTWFVGTLQTEQDRARLREGLLGAGMASAALDGLLDATRKRVFLLHDVHRPEPLLVHSRFALSYLRGPLTREEIGRLTRARPAGAPKNGDRSAPTAEAAPALPAPFRHNYFKRYGGELADAYLLVKYAVRYKDAGETVAAKAWPVAGDVAEILEGEPLAIAESDVARDAPAGVRYSDLPAAFAGGGKAIERALKDRLSDKLAVALAFDPVTKTTSQPGEDDAAFAARLTSSGGGDKAEKLRDAIEKKKRELAAREQELGGRKTEKWAAVATAVISNIGLFTGRKRTITGAGSVLSKNRMENNLEARVEALKAEIEGAEADLAKLVAVDPARFERRTLVPGRGDVKVLRYDVLWVY